MDKRMLDVIKEYIEANYRELFGGVHFSADDEYDDIPADRYQENQELKNILKDWARTRYDPAFALDMTFSEKVAAIMKERNYTAPEVYRRGNVEKSLFSKVSTIKAYTPSKDTAISVALGLKLNPEEASDLLRRAGYSLSHSIKRDVALECCFKEGFYDVIKINILLDELGLKPLNNG